MNPVLGSKVWLGSRFGTQAAPPGHVKLGAVLMQLHAMHYCIMNEMNKCPLKRAGGGGGAVESLYFQLYLDINALITLIGMLVHLLTRAALQSPLM